MDSNEIQKASIDWFGEGLKGIFLAGMSTLSATVLLEVSRALENNKNSIRYEFTLNAVSPVEVKGYLLRPGKKPKYLWRMTGVPVEAAFAPKEATLPN
jgi:hypothetical protein